MLGYGNLHLGIRQVCRHGLGESETHPTWESQQLLGEGIRVDLCLLTKASSESKSAPFDSAHCWGISLAEALVKKLVLV